MEESYVLNILDVLGVDLCAHPILDLVPIKELLLLERVSQQWQQLVHHHLRSSKTLSLQYLKPHSISCEAAASTHRTIDIPFNEGCLQTAITTVTKWGPSITKITTGCCDEELFEAIASNCGNLRCIDFYNLGNQSFPIDQIRNCKNLKKITFKNIRTASESELRVRVASSIVQCRGIEFDNINLDSFATEDFMESIKSINLRSLSVTADHSQGTATLELDGTSMRFIGISPDWHFFMSTAKNAQIYCSQFRHKIEHILEPLFCLDSS